MNFSSYLFPDNIALASYDAKPVAETGTLKFSAA
jgi:hypothetical protein